MGNQMIEVQCYDKLSMIYFNLQDLHNAQHYQRKCLKQELESDESRVKKIAIKEVKEAAELREENRLVGIF